MQARRPTTQSTVRCTTCGRTEVAPSSVCDPEDGRLLNVGTVDASRRYISVFEHPRALDNHPLMSEIWDHLEEDEVPRGLDSEPSPSLGPIYLGKEL